MSPQTSPTLKYTHARFISLLSGWKLKRYSDGGPSDLNRSRKRAQGKAQRRARKTTR
jgi:hypothetical protein